MSLIRRAAGRISARGSGVYGGGSDDPYSIPPNSSLGYSASGVIVNQNTALQLLAVTACVRLISETLSNLSLDAVQDKPNGLFLRAKRQPMIVADPFGGNNVLNGMTRRVGLAQMAVSTLLRGNAYAGVTLFDDMGFPERIRVFAPDMVTVDVSDDGDRVYEINNKPFPAERMLHITGMSLPGSPMGLSVLDYARRTIGLGTAAEEFGARFFGRGANMTGIIRVPGELTPPKARELKENFEAKHSGLSNSHALGVLTGGADFAKISVTPEEAQFLATRQMQTTDIAMMYGVPPHMLGQVDRTTSWGKGIEEQTLGFVKYTMLAWAQRFEDAWSAMLPKNMRAKFNFDDLLRPDTSARFLAYQIARNSSILTPNEIRATENYAPVEGGDDLFAPLNSAHTTEPDWTPGNPEVDPNATPTNEPAAAPDPNAPEPKAPKKAPVPPKGGK